MTDTASPAKPKAYSYIRMSTDGQFKGDSLRRQTAASQQYAVEHGLELAPPIEDIGVSASEARIGSSETSPDFSIRSSAG